MKTHLNLVTGDLERAIAYYAVLLQALPAKRHEDYALFIVDDPGLELALDSGAVVAPSGSVHYGIAVDSVAAVDDAAERLEAAGYAVKIERDQTCCYAKQTKVWSSDPDGRMWEVYAVLEETSVRDDPVPTCCGDADDVRAACC